ncbi:PLP-dependent aminotransferase family protein [Puniceicoccaceae bacterium K14]|nr:PLP-dependent aminotransferase family protein [Puniceicoccaceae bacterium K14]
MELKYSELGLRQKGSNIDQLMADALRDPGMLSLAAGFTDNSTLPLAEVKAIVGELEESTMVGRSALQYGTNQGSPRLRNLLTRRIEVFDGVAENSYSEDGMFITNGSQQGLYLAMQTLCNPGDIVLVEEPTYFVFLEILRGLGIEALPTPMLDSGEIDTPELKSLLGNLSESGDLERVKALYLVSYFANPTGHSIEFNTKCALGHILRETAPHIAIIEDAAYRDLYFGEPFDGGSVLSGDAFDGLSVLYSSTLTKPFATGLKLGYSLCSNSDWLARMLAVKSQQDFGSANFPQVIMEKMLEFGHFDKHLVTIRESYREKMEVLNTSIQPLKDLGWSWHTSLGGLYLWLKAPIDVSTQFGSDFHKQCNAAQVMYVPGSLCYAKNSQLDGVRLSYGVLELDKLTEAGRRFLSAAISLKEINLV